MAKKRKITTLNVDMVEFYISKAELDYKAGRVSVSIDSARKALKLCNSNKFREKSLSLRIFIARGLSRLRQIEASNSIYRSLIGEGVYLPPIIMGLMHNNLQSGNSEKVKRNLHLVKLLAGQTPHIDEV